MKSRIAKAVLFVIICGSALSLGFLLSVLQEAIFPREPEPANSESELENSALSANIDSQEYSSESQLIEKYTLARSKKNPYSENSTREYAENAVVVPILMYHHIEPVPEDVTDENIADLYVSPTMFERQMKYLYLAGYETVSLSDLSRALNGKNNLPDKPVILTFDDLYPSQVEYALPVLNKYDLDAIFFVNVYSSSSYNSKIERVLDSGHQVGCHGYKHEDVRGMTADELDFEMGASKTKLENDFDIKIQHFSYPGCTYDNAAVRAAKNIGYQTAVTCATAWNGHVPRDRYHLARRLVSDNYNKFIARLEDKQGVY